MKKLAMVVLGLLLIGTQAKADVGGFANFSGSLTMNETLDGGETIQIFNDTLIVDIDLTNLVFDTGDTNAVLYLDIDTTGYFADTAKCIVEYANLLWYPKKGSVKDALNDSAKHVYEYTTLGDTLRQTLAEPSRISMDIPLTGAIRLRIRREAPSLADTAAVGEANNATTLLKGYLIGKTNSTKGGWW